MIDIDNIYNMDCLEGMKLIPDNSVDCIICDLPYGTTKNPWDSVIPLDELWGGYKRILKPNGAVVLFGQQPFTSQLVMSNPEWFKYEWIWEKSRPTGRLNANYAPMKQHENILVFSQGATSFTKDESKKATYNPQMSKGKPYKIVHKEGDCGSCYDYKNSKAYSKQNNGTRYPTDILRYAHDTSTFHPTQKPVDLLRYLVLTYSNEGDTILDNTCGSGTTCIACIKEHRHFIGFELNKEYYEKACQRIKREQQQLTLF